MCRQKNKKKLNQFPFLITLTVYLLPRNGQKRRKTDLSGQSVNQSINAITISERESLSMSVINLLSGGATLSFLSLAQQQHLSLLASRTFFEHYVRHCTGEAQFGD
jgi:hypothetical protein